MAKSKKVTIKKQYQTMENGHLYLDGKSIPNDEANRFYRLALTEIEAGEAELLPYVAPEPSAEQVRAEAMLAGIEFEGVMCSATSKDMWGLASIKEYVRNGLGTTFKFENGNSLTLNTGNIDDFEAIWVPFRSSFF